MTAAQIDHGPDPANERFINVIEPERRGHHFNVLALAPEPICQPPIAKAAGCDIPGAWLVL